MSRQPLFVTGYLPEIQLLEDKKKDGVRLLREDCAVLSVEHDFQPIAYRSALQREGRVPADWLIADSKKRALLRRAAQMNETVLLTGKADCLMVFQSLLEATGTVFVVRAPFSAAALSRALHLCGRNCTVLPEPGLGDVRGATLTDELCRWLEEILFYTDRIFRDISLCAMTRAQIISEFLGCRTDRFSLPTEHLPISRTDDLRLTAFLLCVFLSLRARDGRLAAELAPSEDGQLPLACRVHLTEQNTHPSKGRRISENELPFLSLTAFRDIRLSQSPNGLTLEASFPVRTNQQNKIPLLHAHIDELLTLCIELSLDNCADS